MTSTSIRRSYRRTTGKSHRQQQQQGPMADHPDSPIMARRQSDSLLCTLPEELIRNTLVHSMMHFDLKRRLQFSDELIGRPLHTTIHSGGLVTVTAIAQELSNPLTSLKGICRTSSSPIGSKLCDALASALSGRCNDMDDLQIFRDVVTSLHPHGMSGLLALSATCRDMRRLILSAPFWQSVYHLCNEHLHEHIWFGDQVNEDTHSFVLPEIPKFIRDFHQPDLPLVAGGTVPATHMRMPSGKLAPRAWPARDWYARAFFENRSRPNNRSVTSSRTAITNFGPTIFLPESRVRIYEPIADMKEKKRNRIIASNLGSVYVQGTCGTVRALYDHVIQPRFKAHRFVVVTTNPLRAGTPSLYDRPDLCSRLLAPVIQHYLVAHAQWRSAVHTRQMLEKQLHRHVRKARNAAAKAETTGRSRKAKQPRDGDSSDELSPAKRARHHR